MINYNIPKEEIKDINKIISNKGDENNLNDAKNLLINLINDIITGTFISSDKSKQTFLIIHTKYFDFKQYFVYNQNIGSLCGFHSLFNIYYFLKYLTSNEKDENKNNYLLNMKNAWCFWSFYNESINYIFNYLHLEGKAKEYLIKGGPLERYQFIFLLKEFPKIKNLFNEMNNNYEVSFTKFLYGFKIFNGTIDEAIDFQEKINAFMNNNNNKNINKEKILIILLGIVNHWNILILHKNINNKLNIYFLDSRNSPEIFESFELYDKREQREENNAEIESIKDIYIKKEINKKSKNVTNWYITILKEWYDSMNQSMIIIFKILKNEVNLLNFYIEKNINNMINSFNEKTNIDLNNLDKSININSYIDKIWNWINEDYHPAYFKDNILNDLKKTNIKYKEKSFINFINIMDLFLDKENENKYLEEKQKDIIKRYQNIILELKEFINSP